MFLTARKHGSEWQEQNAERPRLQPQIGNQGWAGSWSCTSSGKTLHPRSFSNVPKQCHHPRTSVHIHMLMVTFLIQTITGKQENHCLAPGDLQVTHSILWMLLLPQRCVHPVHVCLDEKAAPRIPGICPPPRSSKRSPLSVSCPGPSSMHCELIPLSSSSSWTSTEGSSWLLHIP